MPERLFLDERQLRQIGFDPRMVSTFRELVKVADAFTRLTSVETGQDQLNDQIDTINEDIEDANLSLTSLDTRVDALENNAPYVSQDDGPAWTDATGTAARTALASYAGQTISNPPTQAEVQTLDDAVRAISQHLVAVINDLKANGALT